MTRVDAPLSFLRCCEQGTRPAPAFSDLATALPKPASRQRTKLWELNGSVHCSVIGTCLTVGELRRVVGKVLQRDISRFTDHALHTEAVRLCDQHNAPAKLLQKALDQRHQTAIRRFGRLHGEEAVMTEWEDARRAGEIPGAYWAVLTHPDVGHAGLKHAFGEVHMLSHLVGAANRADIRRLNALEAENTSLTEKVGRQQVRLHAAITSRDRAVRELGAQLAAEVQPREACRNADDDALASLRGVVRDQEARLATETGRREPLERRFGEAMDTVREWQRRATASEMECEALRRELALLERHGAEIGPASRPLHRERVLYVGGRPSCLERMRDALDASGGELLVHDGGRHDQASLLPGLIGRADRVLFPVDCVSHDAALTVKRLCRQLGKPWTPLRSSGFASFLAALTGETVQAEQEVTPGSSSLGRVDGFDQDEAASEGDDRGVVLGCLFAA